MSEDQARREPIPDARRKRWLRIRIGIYLALLAALIAGLAYMLVMPDEGHTGPLPAPSGEEVALAGALERDIRTLATDIGERNLRHPDALARAASWVEASFEESGYAVSHERYDVRGHEVANLFVERRGAREPETLVVVGAHYDSAPGTPGADDNASGVAALLALARAFGHATPDRTVRFVAFVNEEPPYFQSEHMGSLVHARTLAAEGASVSAMLSLETMAYFRDEAGTQEYPFPLSLFFPSTGDFLGFVSDLGSRDLLHRSIAAFRRDTPLPTEGAALPAGIPGVDWSDHWSFWQSDYPAIMVTDTAPFRNPSYHEPSDLPDELDYTRLARAVLGLVDVIDELAGTTNDG